MNFIRKIYAKLFFKQYTIGILEGDISLVLADKKIIQPIRWFQLSDYRQSLADPFIVDVKGDEVLIMAEIFTTGEHDGKICLISYNPKTGFSEPEIILDEGVHLSYPCIFKEDGRVYVLMTKINGTVLLYEYHDASRSLTLTSEIFNKPLIDATLLKHDSKYWLFGTFINNGRSDNLYIFVADNLFGPYLPHAGNPVKIHLNGCRSAGNFIKADNEIFRPAQNCSVYYGESIVINRVVKLDEQEYIFDDHMLVESRRDDKYNFGIHTINANGRFIVVDGQKGHFQPVLQIARACKRAFHYVTTAKPPQVN